jgi:hypothetical protein
VVAADGHLRWLLNSVGQFQRVAMSTSNLRAGYNRPERACRAARSSVFEAWWWFPLGFGTQPDSPHQVPTRRESRAVGPHLPGELLPPRAQRPNPKPRPLFGKRPGFSSSRIRWARGGCEFSHSALAGDPVAVSVEVCGSGGNAKRWVAYRPVAARRRN